MAYHRNTAEAYGVFILRVALGSMFLAHGLLLKVFTFGVAGTVQFFGSIGLPAPLAYGTIAAETIGGLLLILGVQSRRVALALSPILIGTTAFHAGNGWVFSAAGGGWEYPLYLLLLAGVKALLGDGAHALSPSARLLSRLPFAAERRELSPLA